MMKVAVIGGGSTYTPELVNGFLERASSFPLTELWLMDISQERLDIVGRFAQRMVAAAGAPFEVHLTTDLREAVRGASYVSTQLRVGGMEARRQDEYLGKRHGLIGQETTGVGGMAKALRTIPVIMNIADTMRELAPGALLVNFTNPAGLVTQALSKYAPDIPAAGVCNVPISAKMRILEGLDKQGLRVPPERAELDSLGLNHLTWHRGFRVDGEDVWSQVMQGYFDNPENYSGLYQDTAVVRSLRMFPNYYLNYFYNTHDKLTEQEQWPPSRAEAVMEIENKLLEEYAEPDRTQPPPDLMKRGGAWYSTVATQLLNAHYNDLNETHIVNVKHGGAVAGWPDDWVLEMPCHVGKSGIKPLPAEPLPPACYGLVAAVKTYEILTVEAAIHGDRNAAFQALLAHPLGPEAGQVQAVLDDMLNTHRQHLPQFDG
jgi:6-phospho-beta-glucosidase